MTVCIAAECRGPKFTPNIILCTDRLISGSTGKAETQFKHHLIRHYKNGGSWYALTAGYISSINALLLILATKFGAQEEISEVNLLPTVRDAIKERKSDLANEYTGGHFGLSYVDFLAFGKDKLPSDLFNNGMSAIARKTLRTEMIIAGFTPHTAMLCVISDDGSTAILDGFATIGEGELLAKAALLQRGHHEYDGLGNALYNVYEAKKIAENVPSVGKQTHILIFDPHGDTKLLGPDGEEFLDSKFQEYGSKKMEEQIKLEDEMFW